MQRNEKRCKKRLPVFSLSKKQLAARRLRAIRALIALKIRSCIARPTVSCGAEDQVQRPSSGEITERYRLADILATTPHKSSEASTLFPAVSLDTSTIRKLFYKTPLRMLDSSTSTRRHFAMLCQNKYSNFYLINTMHVIHLNTVFLSVTN